MSDHDDQHNYSGTLRPGALAALPDNQLAGLGVFIRRLRSLFVSFDMSFNNFFFTSILLAVLCTTTVNAVPAPAWSKRSTHGKITARSGLKLEYYQPESQFKTYGEGLTNNTLTWIQNQLQLDDSGIAWQSGWSMHNVSCGYVKQVHDGIPFVNAVGNVMFKDNNAVAFGNSFIDKDTQTAKAKIAPSKPTIDSKDAVAKAESVFDGTNTGLPEPSLKYWVRPDGSAALVHAVQVQNESVGTSYEAFIDAHSGEVLSATDFVSDSTFRGLSVQKTNLDDGLELIVDPEDFRASPNGWNSLDGANMTDTSGNNAIILALNTTELFLEGQVGGNGSLTFDFTYDSSKDPTDPNNTNAARANAFYIANTFHDFTY
ncbi:putative extracellular elastinolytic metalloproteinase precursor [Moniliophthora roreri]|nr:putative extracellular elastinolytic metalloproteinase precursor [Moniliophthora roreri]